MSNVMRESHIMKIHYLTAMLAVALVIVHIMVRIVQGFSDSLLFDKCSCKLPIHSLCNTVRSCLSTHFSARIQWLASNSTRVKTGTYI